MELSVLKEDLQRSRIQGDRPETGGPSWRIWIALVIVLAVAGFVSWRMYSAHQEALAAAQKSTVSANRPVPVLVAEVRQRKMPIYLTALGTVTAYNTVTVRSRVDGQLMKVNFKEGQKVKRGGLLLQIDPEPYTAALELAEGQYARDDASVTMGKAQAARYKGLFDAGVVSQESRQTQDSIYGQAQGALRADSAAIHAAKVNLAYTNIVSPIDGQVGLRQVDVGNIVHAADSTGLVVVTQLQPISVLFTVPEDQLPLIRKKIASKTPLKVDAYDRTMTNKLASGTLLTLDNQIDAATGTDKLKAVFPNKDSALFPNQFVNVRLILEERSDALVIPSSAMQVGNAGNFVYVVKADNTVEARSIANSVGQGALLLLDGGVKAGERVVIDGQEKIHVGSKVVVSKGPPVKGEQADDAKPLGPGKGGKEKGADDAAPDRVKPGNPKPKGKGAHKDSRGSSGAAQ